MTAPTGDHPYPAQPIEAQARDAFTPARANGSTALAIPGHPEIEELLAPYTLNLTTWIKGIFTQDDFPDSDPEEATLAMLAQILTAESSEEALNVFQLDRARELCGGEPGGRSPVLEFTGARALKSDYAEGAACYAIISAVKVAEGEKIRFTTGSRAVQTVVAAHMLRDWMPFKGALEIRRERTKRGFYPLNLVAGI